MTIAIVGAGKVGSTFAYYLTRAGHDVTVVARPASARLAQLRRDKGVLRTTGERAPTRVADAVDDGLAYDLVVVTVLDHQVDALLPALARSQARCIHFMFNTFTPERLRDALGGRPCTFGMPFVMATLDSTGRLDATVSASRRTLHSDPRWVALFDDAGVSSALEANMTLWLRCHVPFCIAMESVAVMAQRRGAGASWPEARAVAHGLHASFSIIKGLGDRPYPVSKRAIDILPVGLVACLLWLVSRVRTVRVLLATGEAECRALIDTVTAAAVAAKPALVPAAEALLAIRPKPDQHLSEGKRTP